MRISDWSSDVCSSDLQRRDVVAPVAAVEADLHGGEAFLGEAFGGLGQRAGIAQHARGGVGAHAVAAPAEQAPHRLAGDLAGEVPEREVEGPARSEEHTSELQSLMRISYAVFCLKKKTK